MLSTIKSFRISLAVKLQRIQAVCLSVCVADLVQKSTTHELRCTLDQLTVTEWIYKSIFLRFLLQFPLKKQNKR